MVTANVLPVNPAARSAAERPSANRGHETRPGGRWTAADVRKATGLTDTMLIALAPDGCDEDGFVYDAAKFAAGLSSLAWVQSHCRGDGAAAADRVAEEVRQRWLRASAIGPTDPPAKTPPVRRFDAGHVAPPPRLPTVPNATATAYWTRDDLCRLFGIPAALAAALAPAAVAGDEKHDHHLPCVEPGSPLYDPEPVARAMQEFAALRAERRKAEQESRPLPPAEVGSHRHRKEVRDAMFAADRRCRYCGRGIRRRSDATIDHMIPVAQGGSDAADNLTLACQRCNVSKADRTPEEWAAQILAAQPAVKRAPDEPPRPTAGSESPDRFEALRNAQDALYDVEVRLSNLYGDAITANGKLDTALRELLGREAVAEEFCSESEADWPKAPTEGEGVQQSGSVRPATAPRDLAAVPR